jgi:predicted glycosyltransferase involved in capsule biosynthesis
MIDIISIIIIIRSFQWLKDFSCFSGLFITLQLVNLYKSNILKFLQPFYYFLILHFMVSEIFIIPVSHSQLLVLTHSQNDHVWEKCDSDVMLLECTVAVTLFYW